MRMRLSVGVVLLVGTMTSAAEPAPVLPEKVTFSQHIAPLVFENCTSCHRAGEVAPFTLSNYAETKRKAKTMLREMQARTMPPWSPEPGHGEFRDERRLTPTQIALFEKWIADGMPEGDANKTPPLPKFPEGWRLGKPDLIVKMDKPFTVPAAGPDLYQNFVIPLNLTEDKWVTAVEFRSTAPATVHHMLYDWDDTGRARKQDATTPEPGFPGLGGIRGTPKLGGWAVGAIPSKLPEGLAMPIKKGADLVIQTHFHPSGKAETEQLTMGLYFADKAPKKLLSGIQLPPAFGLFSGINIPAGKADFKVSDSFTLPVDVEAIGVGGHAHYLGKTMTYTATLPDKTVKKLFYIKDWDFNWQGQYYYKDFVKLPKGTVLHAEVTWDNSDKNPRNPNNPPVAVKWGESTNDEMGSVTLRVVCDTEADTTALRQGMRRHATQRYAALRLQGKDVDWDALGIPKPDFFKDIPFLPKKK